MRVATFSLDPGSVSLPALDHAFDSENALLLAFGAPASRDSRVFADLRAAFPRAHLLGCSTAGEIQQASVIDGTVTLAMALFEGTHLRSVGAAVSSPEQSLAAGIEIATQLGAPTLRGVLVLSDGTVVNGSKLVEGLKRTLPRDVPITGGLAGDGTRFKETWVLSEGCPAPGRVSAVGFYGERSRISCGSGGGWGVFGPERIVTRSSGNVLFEIDGQPALHLYKRYLGDLAAELPSSALLFPLGLLRPDCPAPHLVRTILSINEDAGSMTFAGDIPQGSTVQFMRASLDRLVDGASEAARRLTPTPGYAPSGLLLAVSCVGRRLVLGDRSEEEIEAVLQAVDGEVPLVGFYSYGEISPQPSSYAELHNQTMTLALISED